MFAVLQIPSFPLHALLRFNPALRGEAVAVLEGEGRRARIAHRTPGAVNVSPGMTAAQALAECPSLQLVPPSLVGEREAGSLLLTAGWSIAPRVDATAAGLVTVDLTGADLRQLRQRMASIRAGLAVEGLPVRVGVAANPLLARYAAYHADPECWVEDTRAFLQPLPVTLLDPTESELRLLDDLGLRTLGAITVFPRASFANRLGARGDELWAKAAGEYSRPIQPAPLPTRHRADMDLEEPVETLDPLLFVLRRFCERLALEVGQFGGGTSKLSLTLRLDDDKQIARDFDLPEPTASPDILFAVLENHLSSLHTDAPIIGLSLEAFPARRLQTQEGLFDTGLKDAPMFYATLGRLAAVVGSGNVGTPRRADSHRPDSIQLVPPSASVPERVAPAAPPATGPLLRRLRPPSPATVELTDARPSFLFSDHIQGEVKVLRRPVWSNGDWWAAAWAREEWDVQIGPGLYRLLHDPSGWFIEGIYD
jgi:protein ImuB